MGPAHDWRYESLSLGGLQACVKFVLPGDSSRLAVLALGRIQACDKFVLPGVSSRLAVLGMRSSSSSVRPLHLFLQEMRSDDPSFGLRP